MHGLVLYHYRSWYNSIYQGSNRGQTSQSQNGLDLKVCQSVDFYGCINFTSLVKLGLVVLQYADYLFETRKEREKKM